MAADVVRLQRVLHVAHGGAALAGSAQFGVLVDREAVRRFIGFEPAGHHGHWRALHTERLQRHLVDGLEQQLDDVVGLGRAGRIDHEPAIDRVDPGPDIAAQREGARQQFVGHALLQFLHGFFAWREALRFFHLGRLGLGHLVDDRCRQQFLFGAQHDQHLLVHDMDQAAVRARCVPALAQQFVAVGRHEAARLEGLFQLFRGVGPRGRQAVDLEILEPHRLNPLVSVFLGNDILRCTAAAASKMSGGCRVIQRIVEQP